MSPSLSLIPLLGLWGQWMDGWVDRWMDLSINGSIDGWMGQMGRAPPWVSDPFFSRGRWLAGRGGCAPPARPIAGFGFAATGSGPGAGSVGLPTALQEPPFYLQPLQRSPPLAPSFCSCTPKRTAGMPGCRGAPHKAEKPPAVGCPPLEGAVMGLGAACPSPASPAPSPKRP